MMRWHVVAVLAFSLSLGALASAGQATTGTPPLGTFSGGPDVIDMANLNAHISVPLLRKQGRGIPFYYDLTYDSSIWSPTTSGSTTSWQPVSTWGWGEQTSGAVGHVVYLYSLTTFCYTNRVPTGTEIKYYDWIYYDPQGTSHFFGGTVLLESGSCGSLQRGFTSTATDGSGYTLTVTSSLAPTVQTRDGTVIVPPLGQPTGTGTITDRNGNQISASSGEVFTDTLGTTALTISGTGAPSSPMTYTYTGPSGAVSYTVNYTSYTVRTNFGCSGIAEFGPTAENLVSSIVRPDGATYTFNYESTPGYSGDVTGRIASVTLPTGGTITYSYSGGNNGIVCADGSTATLTRTVTPNYSEPAGTWTYAHSESGTAWVTTVTDPAGNQTVMNFQGLFETDRKTYNGSATGTPLAEVQTCYNGAARPCTGTSITFPISQRSVYNSLPLGSSWLVSEKNFLYNTYGLVTEEDDYDYGTNNPGTLLRKTLIQYASLGNNILDQPSSITVQNASGGTVAQTTYNYDANGDMLSETAGGLTKSFTYNSNGAVATTTDVNNAQTSFTYGSGSCNGAFPTSVSLPLSLRESFTWNCNGGVVTSATDESGGTTTITYNDPDFWRPNAVTDPMNNRRGITYQPNSSYASPFMVASSLTFNGGSSIESDVKYEDGFGRPFVDQKQESPGSSTLDTVSYNFDANGRLASVSVPCAVSYVTRCSTPQTTYEYDALNRPVQITDGGNGYTSYSYSGNDAYVTVGPAPSGENTKRRQLQYDGLGRLSSVCEVTGLTGSGSCGQNSAQTGYWTKYSYDALGDLTGVVQNAQSGDTQSRSYSFDGLGRMTSETETESGTTTYVYDSDSNCGTYKGDLVKTVDAVGNVACYSYDALHRLTSVTYSGPYAGNTPNRYFVYDAATVDGAAMAHTGGRLAEAYTATCQTCSKITDLGFSYDADGRVAAAYESTPHSSGYYVVTANYWANGALNILNGLPGLPKITYGVDGEGRPSTVSASSGQNPVTGTTYNPASEPLGVTLGSGDSDSYEYDSDTGLTTQYEFKVNGQYEAGNLIWNANGTLATLGIIDPFYGANSQNCAYAHDDLARIASVQCGTDQLSNPGFEEGSTGWSFGTGAQLITGDTAGAHSGSSYADISTSVSADFASTQYIPVSQGQVVTFGGWAYRVSGTSGYARWKIVATDANKNPVAYPGGDNVTAAAWTYQENTYTVPSGVYYVKLYAEIWDATAATEAKFDDGFLQVGTSMSETYTYDAFGNIEKNGSMSFMPAYSWQTNHMTSIGSFTPTYDANGNVTNDGLNSFAWDANGRPTTTDGVTVTYDALGRMVEQDNGGTYTEIVYGPTGAKLAVMIGQTMEFSYVPLPGGALAEYHTNGYVEYRHGDWLGSDRLISDQYRAVTYDGAFAPFGESYAESGTAQRSFTGQLQTITSNVYDFPFREYGIQGRWPSPDPLGPDAFNLTDPRSLNRYAYVLNNPTGLIDPLGLVNLPGYNQLVGAYGNLGGGVQFGASWNEFELLQAAFTPTGQLTIPDSSPDCLATGDCGPTTTVPVFGNIGLLGLLGVGPGGVFDGPGSLLPSGPVSSGPQSQLRPPTQQEYNACVQTAASARDSTISSARWEQAGGGLLTLAGTAVAWYSLPALGEAFFNEGAPGFIDFAHAGGFAYFGAVGPFAAGIGLFAKGTYGVANAWNDYYANTIQCAADVSSHP